MDKNQAVFEQLTFSDFKIWSSTSLKTFNNFLQNTSERRCRIIFSKKLTRVSLTQKSEKRFSAPERKYQKVYLNTPADN